jgi:penicillin-binding protein 2
MFPNKQISRRATIITAGMMTAFPILFGRSYYLQHVKGQRYRKMADKNRMNIRPTQPIRAPILDRNGQVIAHDIKYFRLSIIKEQCPNPEKTLKKLAKIIKLSPLRQKRILKQMKQHKAFTPVTIVKNITFNDLVKVQVNLADLQGVDLVPILLRKYPAGSSIGHLTGYVGVAPKHMVEEDWPTDFPTGRRGLEKVHNLKLRGTPGVTQSETNAHGREIRKLDNIPQKNEKPFPLTIDLSLQQYIWDKLQNYTGCATVMDIHTGALHAAVSHPSFNPNQFVEGFNQQSWEELLNNPSKPLLGRVFQGTYSPGSTFKLVVALAALEEGLITPNKKVTCKNHIFFGDRDFHCWKKHGRINLERAIAESCDIYFYELGKELGIEKMAHYAKIFGLGDISSIGLPELAGNIPTPAWKKRKVKEPWTGGDNLITAIGQGYLLNTPLQLTTMTSRLISGKMVKPIITLDEEKRVKYKDLSVNPKHLKFIQNAMIATMHTPRGTAYSSRPKSFKMGGKTGTVQVISKRLETAADIAAAPKNKRPHGLFVGYAPANKPRFATCVFLENVGSGGRYAAPIAKKILAKTLALNKGAGNV